MAMVILDVVCWLLVYTEWVPMPGMMWLMQRGLYEQTSAEHTKGMYTGLDPV